jgi:hypothetical protein
MKHLRLAKKNRETNPESWEQLYKSEINRRIRMRYSVDDELSLHRQRDDKPEEFAEYNAYVEGCKAEVKAMLKEGDTSENNNI